MIAPDDGEVVSALAVVSREFARGRSLLAGNDAELPQPTPSRPGNGGRFSKVSRTVESGLSRVVGATYPGHPEWVSTTLDDRVNWWVNRLGTVLAATASVPAAGGRLASATGLQNAVGASGQGLIICAVGHELGVEECSRQVKVMSKVILGRDLPLDKINALLGNDGAAVLESRGPDIETKTQLVVRLAQRLRGIDAALSARPRGRTGGRLISGLPGIGAVSGFVSERGGIKSAAEQAVPLYQGLI